MIDCDVIQRRKKEALLWCSSKHLGSGDFDQRCNVNLIKRISVEFISELGKSNRVETEFSHFVSSSMFTSCIMM